MLKIKEKREVGFIIGSVLLVAIVGLILSVSLHGSNKQGALSGQAVAIDSSTPTVQGTLALLENSCQVVENINSESCFTVCHSQEVEQYCVPLEESCSKATTFNCYCCQDSSIK